MTIEAAELSVSARQVMEGLGLAADASVAWDQIAELGWLMLEIAEESGGLGLGLPAACALHGELGRGLATVPYVAASLSIDAIGAAGVAGGVAWLERLGRGAEYVATPLAACAIREDNGALSGTASAVPAADRASHVIAWTRTADLLVLVPLDAPGVQRLERPTWDRTRHLFDVRLEEVAVDACRVLARAGDAAALVHRLLLRRDFALAAESVGGARAALERTVAYLGERCQFGRPLAMFQALKHRCADLKAQVEAAAALLASGLSKSTDEAGNFAYTPAAATAGQAAKLLSASAYTSVTEESLQLHGGIGMTAEHECHLFLKRAMLDEQLGRGRDDYANVLAADYLAREQQDGAPEAAAQPGTGPEPTRKRRTTCQQKPGTTRCNST